MLPGTGCRGRWSDPNGPTSGCRYCCVTPAAAHRGRAEKELDKSTAQYVAQIDELVKHKEGELLEV